jgi:hypothetical protein
LNESEADSDLGLTDWSSQRWAEVARQVLLDRDLEVEVRVGGEISQAEAPDPEGLLDAVFVQRMTSGEGNFGGHRDAATSGRSG